MDIYQVGGAVRDRLLGIPVYDHDWVVVGAEIEQMLELGYRPVGKDFPVFLHPQTHEEYALARTERKSGRGYTGFQFHAATDVSLEQDLLRRDLTINAIAADSDGTLIDPYGGQKDLARRRLRHVSPAFAEDPLRVLRVARFLAKLYRFGFSIDPATLTLMRELSANGELQALSAERVWKETERALGEANPEQYFISLARCGALQQLMSELAEALPEIEPEIKTVPSGFQPLIHACTLSTQTAVRWAVLCSAVTDPASLERLQIRLRIPRLFRDTALLLGRYQPLLTAPLTADRVLAIYQGLDLQRRPERLTPFIEGCQAIAGISLEQPFPLAEQLQALFTLIVQIQPRLLVNEGFKGAELGLELHRRQWAVVDKALDSTNQKPSSPALSLSPPSSTEPNPAKDSR